MLLDFDQLTGDQKGVTLSNSMVKTLKDCDIGLDRVLCLTTDGASNNGVMFQHLQQLRTAINIASTEMGMERSPCLAHIIQLATRELLGTLKITAKNDRMITCWQEKECDREKHTDGDIESGGIPWTLKKVYHNRCHELYSKDPANISLSPAQRHLYLHQC